MWARYVSVQVEHLYYILLKGVRIRTRINKIVYAGIGYMYSSACLRAVLGWWGML